MRCWLAAIGLAIGLVTSLASIARADDRPAPKAPAVTRPPKLLQAVAPEYPKAALDAGKTAKVKVRIQIDATGIVTKVEVLEKVGDGFDEAAVAAAMQYVFEPAEIDGKPGAIGVETTINFVIELQEEPEPAPPPNPPTESTWPQNHAGDLK
ncbi:MAG: energy transducer TonB, partial [Kofleriaceae bacterium]